MQASLHCGLNGMLLMCCRSIPSFIYDLASGNDISYYNRARDPEYLVKDLQDSFNVNVIGNFHLFNLFTPLVLKGQGKKVIAISSGMSDIDFIRQFEIEPAPAYAISKAGTNVLTAKFAARYAKEGVLFMSICPGSVDSGFEGECK